MKKKLIISFLVLLCLSFNFVSSAHLKKRKIRKLFKRSNILNNHFTGFALYDLDEKKMIYELNDSLYFIPASNTKLFTYYTCLRMLGDSIPSLKYIARNDSLIFWGTGDPSFLHTALKGSRGFDLLKHSLYKLYFSSGVYTGSIYGSGWAWDDYNDYYQAEITELPLEDNVAILYTDANDSLQIKPGLFKRYLRRDSSYRTDKFGVRRDFLSDTFNYPAINPPKDFRQEIPWKTSTATTIALLQDTLKKTVTAVNQPMPLNVKTIYDINSDTVYRHMLQPSDNFIAEQLLLVCSSTRFSRLSTDSVILYSKAHFLNDLPDEPQWVDGSGLSRYNLFTPRSMVKLLCKILEYAKNEALVHSLLPAGGIAGTMKNTYPIDDGKPFIWAKTGSLSNNYNQSGYLITRKGKRLAFSFMNNNFTGLTSKVKDEMVRILTLIHEKY